MQQTQTNDPASNSAIVGAGEVPAVEAAAVQFSIDVQVPLDHLLASELGLQDQLPTAIC